MTLQDAGIVVAILAGIGGLLTGIYNIIRTSKADIRQEKTEDEKKRDIEEEKDRAYWREVAEDCRKRIAKLEEADAMKTKEIEGMRVSIRDRDDALEYLMDQVRADFPVAVFIASEVATGKRKRPVNGN